MELNHEKIKDGISVTVIILSSYLFIDYVREFLPFLKKNKIIDITVSLGVLLYYLYWHLFYKNTLKRDTLFKIIFLYIITNYILYTEPNKKYINVEIDFFKNIYDKFIGAGTAAIDEASKVVK